MMPGRRAGSGVGKYTKPRAQKRAAKGSTLLWRKSLVPNTGYIIYLCMRRTVLLSFSIQSNKTRTGQLFFLSTNKGNQFSDITIKDEFFGIWNPVFISLINGCLEDAGTKTLCDGVFVTHCLWTCFRRSRDAIFDHQTLFLPLSLIWRLRPPKSKLFQEDHSR